MTTENHKFSLNKVATFLTLAFFISFLIDLPSIVFKPTGETYKLLVTASMWGPAIAAILTQHLYGGTFKTLGWSWPTSTMLIKSFLVPVSYSIVSYLFIWLLGLGIFYDSDFIKETASSMGVSHLSDGWVIIIYFLFTGTFGLIRTSANALGEEIGWRGFLVPELSKRYSYLKTSLITGLIWAAWHYDVLIFSDYNNGTPVWFGLSCFTVMVVSSSFIYTWFRLKSDSIFPCMILHASHNLYIQRIFTPLTKSTDLTPWFIDEFGLILPIATTCFAVYFILNRHNLEKKESSNPTDGIQKSKL